MCSTCGCGGSSNLITITKIGDEVNHEHFHAHADAVNHGHHHHHHHGHDHGHHHHHHHGEHDHAHSHGKKTVIELEQDIMQENNLLAARNRGYFEAKNMKVLNLVSSPGSGKTSLLEKTLVDLKDEINCSVIEGDQQTSNDASRIAETRVPVVQVNTGHGCHLDADMIHRSLRQLNPANDSVLFIENVGNLVCPALFDLGEQARVVIMSVTEGDDKPIKYPDMFDSAHLCIINKIDLLPYVNFDVEKSKKYARQINPKLEFIELSATTGEGIEQWYDWIRKLE